MRSTAEWEAALAGTTEGNWIQAQGVEVWAEGDNGANLFVGSAYQHNESREDNARLFALAPEAVAEVIRLRRELEELRDHYVKRTTSCRERAADATKFFERRNSLRFAYNHALTHEALTRILEGTRV